MARTRSGPISKLNEVTDEYERALKSGKDSKSGALQAGLVDDEDDLDSPELTGTIGKNKFPRSSVPADDLNDARVYRAKKKLKKAESEE